MPEVAFHFNAIDRMDHVCRLLRKAVSNGAQVVVTGAPDTLQQLNSALWAFSPVDFVPHCHLQDDARVVTASPVILATSIQSVPHRQVLLNLGHEVPEGFASFERVIEVIGVDEEDIPLARTRWKYYAGHGYTMTHHDIAAKAPH